VIAGPATAVASISKVITLEFVLGFLLAVATGIIAYLAYRTQLSQSFKRLHYTSFITPLIFPTMEEGAPTITVGLNGETFINPLLCAARIENTGRAPVVPADFDGPLAISCEGPAIFRTGQIECNPPGIIDINKRPDVLGVELSEAELRIGPVLLNPHDNITVVYIADAAPDDWELKVSGRIAGIEEIIKLPRLIEGTRVTVFSRPISTFPYPNFDSARPSGLHLTVMVMPVLACSGDSLGQPVNVFVDGEEVADAHIVNFLIDNVGKNQSSSLSGRAAFQLLNTTIIKLNKIAADGDADIRLAPDIQFERSTVSFNLPHLQPGTGVNASLIVSGNCPNTTVSTSGFTLESAQLMHTDTSKVIESNLAQAEPRLLLSNQRLYRKWHDMQKVYPWLRRLPPSNL